MVASCTWYRGLLHRRAVARRNPYRTRSRPYVELGMLGEINFGKVSLSLIAENLLNMRVTRYGLILRPAGAADDRWAVDAWAPLDGFTVNGGMRFRFGGQWAARRAPGGRVRLYQCSLRLRRCLAPDARRLLRFLFLWHHAKPANLARRGRLPAAPHHPTEIAWANSPLLPTSSSSLKKSIQSQLRIGSRRRTR